MSRETEDASQTTSGDSYKRGKECGIRNRRVVEEKGIAMKAKDDAAMTSEKKTEETPPYEKPSHCLICGLGGPVLLYGHWICDHCKNVVQAEAVALKRKIVKEGGGPV